MEAQQVDKGIEAVSRLVEALEAECGATARLLAALQAERASIISGRLEELYGACRERAALVEGVRAAQEAMAGAVAALEGGPEGLSEAIRRLPRGQRPRLWQLRSDINRLRQEVAALSEENRLCIGEALAYIDAALAILTGIEAAAGTYGEARAKSGPAVISSEV